MASIKAVKIPFWTGDGPGTSDTAPAGFKYYAHGQQPPYALYGPQISGTSYYYPALNKGTKSRLKYKNPGSPSYSYAYFQRGVFCTNTGKTTSQKNLKVESFVGVSPLWMQATGKDSLGDYSGWQMVNTSQDVIEDVDAYTVTGHSVTSESTTKGSITAESYTPGGDQVIGKTKYYANGTGTRKYTATPKAGYAFDHWTRDGGTVNGATLTVETFGSKVTAKAYFNTTYTIVFNGNGATSGSVDSMPMTYGETKNLNPNGFARTGYTFAGWATSADGQATYSNGDPVSNLTSTAGGTVTLYAVWSPVHTNISFVQTNATQYGTSSAVAEYDAQMPPVVLPTRTGYTFDGYYDASTGGTKYYNADGTSARSWNKTSGSATLYVRWARATHRVTVTNTQPSICRLTVSCADPAMSAEEVNGVLAFDAAELSNYEIVATYFDAFNAKKYVLTGFSGGGSTYATEQTGPLTRRYVYPASSSAPTNLKSVFETSGQYQIETVVSCRLDPQPVVTLTPPADSADGWFRQNVAIGIDYNGNDAVEFETWSATRDGAAQPYDSYNPEDPEPMVFTVDANMTLRVAFRVKTCEATAGVQTASAAVVGSDAATVEIEQYTTGQTHWGDTATFAARTTGLPTGVQFDGWYKPDGTPADDVTVDGVAYTYRDATYKAVLAGDLRLFAAYSAAVSLRTQVMPGSSASGKVGVNGVFQSGSTSANVRLGDTCAIAVRTDSFFGGWFEGVNPSYATEIPLAYEQGDEIRVTGTRTLTVFLLDEEEFNYVALYNFDSREGHEDWDPTLGNWSLVGEVRGFEEITRAQYEAAMTEWKGSSYAAPTDGRFFKMSGIKRATLRVQSAGALGFANIRRYHVDDLTEPLEQFDVNVATAVVNDHYVFIADWGTPARRTITATRANGTERAFGDISIENGTEAGDGSWSVQEEQNAYVTLVAVPRNGYKFVGWFAGYDHAGAPESTEREFRLKVQSNATYYAMFAQDANAIYEWEGSAVAKRLEWRSKMFVASKPFNPVALRVDALGYPVECEVGVFSSPEAEAVRKGRVSPASQMARRLPLLRPERYVQMTVRAEHEVDRIVVGTSMEGLNV